MSYRVRKDPRRRGGSPATPIRKIALRQLVLVATAWRNWSLDGAAQRAIDRLIVVLLDSVSGDNPVDAWLAVTKDGMVRPPDWVGGAPAHKELRKFLDRLATAAALDGAEREHEITHARLRVLCGPDRTKALFNALHGRPDDAGPRHWTTLDVQFVSDRATRFQVHLGFSFWAVRPPWCPADVDKKPKLIEPDAIPSLATAFEERAGTATRNLVDRHFGPSTTLVWQREHAPPMFWVATPAKPPRNLSQCLDDPAIAERLVRPLLGRGPRDGDVAASIVKGNVLVLRHFRQERDPATGGGGADGDGAWRGGAGSGGAGGGRSALRPVYFCLPDGRPPDDANGDRDGDGPKDYRHQQMITSLTKFEARAATDMHRIDDDLEVWGTHVRVYDSIAEQAGTLWDALALHLPVRKGRRLAATHRAIALVHQTLLQGVADLADLESHVMALTTEVDELSDELTDLVDERLAERSLSTAYHRVGESLAQMSQLSRLRRLSEVVVTDARRVKRQYEDQLASIAHAFDERRVRELDVLQRGNFSLSIAVSAVTAVAVLDFIYNVKSTARLDARWLDLLRGSGWALLGGLMLSIGYYWLLVRKARHITSQRFRKGYEVLLRYLRDSSTRELDLHRSLGGRPAAGDRAAWAELDHELAVRFASLWDDATAGRPRAPSNQRAPADDIELLAQDVERWARRALLLTERPRRLSRYRLPALTLLYRHCAALDRARQWETVSTVVADVDLELALNEAGYSVAEAHAIDRYIGGLTQTRQRSAAAGTEPPGTTRLLHDIERVLDRRTPVERLEEDNRELVKDAVRWLTRRGVQQFIDVGAGLPESDGVHMIVKNAKVLYVDHAPGVVLQGQALLREPGRTKFVHADMVRHADTILVHARALFDFDRPVAVLFTRVLGYQHDAAVRTTLEKFAELFPGAYIVISHVASPAEPGSLSAGGLERVPTNDNGTQPERIRSQAKIQGLVERAGLRLRMIDAAELRRAVRDGTDAGARTADGTADGLPDAGPPTQKIHIAAGIGRVPGQAPKGP
jgi:hypothetical protein